MRPLTRAVAIALLALAVLAGPSSSPASADTKQCGGRGRPACSILRPADALAIEVTGRLGPECVVLVGGFDSTSGDTAFDDLLKWTNDDPSYSPLHFGAHRRERFAYDTTGPIDRSAEELGLFVKSLKSECSTFHLITHSMGGAVADRAFANEWLSPADGVETYIALSGPHNGAAFAKALRPPIEADPVVALELSLLARSIGQGDPTTAAARDLARMTTPHRVIRGLTAARLRLATDAMVLRRDAIDRRVETREYLPDLAFDQLDGHGGILHTREVRRVVHDALTADDLPPDARRARDRELAAAVSRAVDADVGAAYARLSEYLLTDPDAPLTLAKVTIPAVVARALADAVAQLAEDPTDPQQRPP